MFFFLSCCDGHYDQDAIQRFHGYEWQGKVLRVESIRDDPKGGRVRVPESLVEYVLGQSKKTRNGTTNTLRRISRDDVERLSRGQPSKHKGYGSRNVPHRLNEEERSALERAANKGYLTVSGGGNRRTRKGSPLINLHRQWCDARAKPQVILYKAVGGRAVDEVVVDFAPLRLQGLWHDQKQVEEFMVQWKTDLVREAYNAGMEIQTDEEEEEEEENVLKDENEERTNSYTITIVGTSQKAWAEQPIWKLPVVNVGIFVGERSKAKNMATTLAKLWEIPEPEKGPGEGAKTRRTAGARGGGRTKTKGISEYRRGSHRDSSWY